jgi:hypothetical protein
MLLELYIEVKAAALGSVPSAVTSISAQSYQR